MCVCKKVSVELKSKSEKWAVVTKCNARPSPWKSAEGKSHYDYWIGPPEFQCCRTNIVCPVQGPFNIGCGSLCVFQSSCTKKSSPFLNFLFTLNVCGKKIFPFFENTFILFLCTKVKILHLQQTVFRLVNKCWQIWPNLDNFDNFWHIFSTKVYPKTLIFVKNVSF